MTKNILPDVKWLLDTLDRFEPELTLSDQRCRLRLKNWIRNKEDVAVSAAKVKQKSFINRRVSL